MVTHVTAGWPAPSWRRSPWCAVAAREQSNRRPRIGHGEPGALPVSAGGYASSTRPTCLGISCVAAISEMHTYTFTLVGTCTCTCPEAVRPMRDKGSGHIQLQRSDTFSRRQLKFRTPPGRAQIQGSWEESAHLYTYLSWARAESLGLSIRRYKRQTRSVHPRSA